MTLLVGGGAVSLVSDVTPVAAAIPPAADDVLTANPVGEPVVIEVLLNDDATVDPSTLALVDPVSGAPRDEVIVAGEGTWSIVTPWSTETWRRPPDIEFRPEGGFTGSPSPIEYTVADDRGNVGRATITIDFQDVARSDASLDNPIDGATISIEVFANDDPSVLPQDVRFASPDREIRKTRWIDYSVSGEGVWEPRIDDTMEFFPDEGFRGNPTPQQYSVFDRDGNEYFATLTISYAGLDPDDTLLNNPSGAPVSIDVLGNDPIGFDADTLMLVDPASGQETVSLEVGAEGVWAVGLDRRITFTPAEGFADDPTPVGYTVSYPSGATGGATVTLTFQDLVRNDCSVGNLRGREVAIEVLDNDDESLRFQSLALSGALRERRQPGETRQDRYSDRYYRFRDGTWTVDALNLRIVYEPDNTSNLAPTPQEYSLVDADGVEYFGTITVTYEGAPTPPESACGVVSAAPTTTQPVTTVPVTTTALVTELPATGRSTVPVLALASAFVALGTVVVRRNAIRD